MECGWLSLALFVLVLACLVFPCLVLILGSEKNRKQQHDLLIVRLNADRNRKI